MSLQRPRVTDIEQQIAQLRWRRQQNERSIRSALETTKVLKQKDTILGITVDHSAEKSMWTNSIVRDELSRPLIVNDDELHQIQYDEAKIKKRLFKYAHQQLDNVNKMIDEKEKRVCKTIQGEEIRVKQLEHLRSSKVKLLENLANIDKRAPYIDVRVAVQKIF
mmetsp:Transcript_25896/g.44460  ORF Transcript_25896/g.44460 Transcript_25896/m.44460 type:complete len:164 (-) Transcript_25896:100-591(-)